MSSFRKHTPPLIHPQSSHQRGLGKHRSHNPPAEGRSVTGSHSLRTSSAARHHRVVPLSYSNSNSNSNKGQKHVYSGRRGSEGGEGSSDRSSGRGRGEVVALQRLVRFQAGRGGEGGGADRASGGLASKTGGGGEPRVKVQDQGKGGQGATSGSRKAKFHMGLDLGSMQWREEVPMSARVSARVND